MTFDYIFVAEVVDDASGGIAVQLFDCIGHFVDAHIESLHLFGDELNLELAHVPADNRHLRYAAESQQARTYCFVGDGVEVHQRGRVCRKTDNHDFAKDGRLRTEGRGADARRQGLGESRHTLGNNLACTVDIGSPVEFNPDGGKAGCRCGTYAAHAGRPVDRSLDRVGDEFFNLFGSHTWRFGHDHNRWRVEVGEDVDFASYNNNGAEHQYKSHQYQYCETVVE